MSIHILGSVSCSDKQDNATIYFDPNCKTYPVLIYDSEITTTVLPEISVSQATVPCILQMQQSNIPGGGNGIFTKYGIPEGFIFGPYIVN